MTTPVSAQNGAEILVTKFKATGGFYAGPVTAKQPTDASTPLDTALKPLGYIGKDGLKRARNFDQYEVIAAGSKLIKTVPKVLHLEYEITLMQSDAQTLTEVFGPENVITDPVTGVVRIRHNAKAMPLRTFVFEMADGANSLREVVAVGQVVKVGDVHYGIGEETTYTITIQAMDDAFGDKANTYQEFGDGPAAGGSTGGSTGSTGGTTALATAAIINGDVDHLTIDNPGSGYTSDPVVNITGDGSGATAQAHVSGGQVVNLTMLTVGSGYTYADVTISAP